MRGNDNDLVDALRVLDQVFQNTEKQTKTLVRALQQLADIPDMQIPKVKAEQPWYRMNQKW